MTIEALVRVHIGLPAVPDHWLHERYSICILAFRAMSPEKLIYTNINMTILPIALCRRFCICCRGCLIKRCKLVIRSRGGIWQRLVHHNLPQYVS